MGVRCLHRINFGSGLGLNLSKSGASPNCRTKAGSFDDKSFSIRTGIPDLAYRSLWGKGSSGIAIGLFVLLSIAAINIAFVLAIVAFKVVVALVAVVFNILWFLVAGLVNGVSGRAGAIARVSGRRSRLQAFVGEPTLSATDTASTWPHPSTCGNKTFDLKARRPSQER